MDFIWLIILFQAIVFGFFSSFIAKEKGRDTGGWFFLGFLFSILAIFALIAIPKHQVSSSNNISKIKKCPDCAEEIKYEAKVCRFCGKRFEEVELQKDIIVESDQQTSSQISKNQRMERCPTCYNWNYHTDKHCSACGNEL
jgi:hypothetical protein